MPVLDKAALQAATQLKVVDVPIPEAGDGAVVRLRELSAADVERWRAAGDLSERAAIRLVVHCAITEDGAPLFASEDEVAALPFRVADRLGAAALELNDLQEKDEDAVKN